MEIEGKVTQNATCEKCMSYLRCCLNCRFHDPVAYNECREPQAPRVKEKEKACFCEFFEVASNPNVAENNRKEGALKKLNDLFKKS